MIKNIEIELGQDIINFLKNGKTLAFLTTYSDKESPYLTPISTMYPKNKESILITMLAEGTGYKNMVWQKKVVLSIFDQNMAFNIIGRAGIILAPSRVHPLMHVAQIDIIDIVNESPMLISLDSGLRWRHASFETKVLHDALIKELYEIVQNN